ncbi:MAG: DUF2891 domain-containing protein [Candidatus Krumholzibacteria bacterium]|nr:DUF2891 domain-containing protein [Candidatus Krumholzibacteria bacterium]
MGTVKERKMKRIAAAVTVCLLISAMPVAADEDRVECLEKYALTEETASGFARIALHCVHREFPNKTGHVMNDSSEVAPPAVLHPAFYGCFDWHSSVHGHWMLVRLLGLFPEMPEAPEIRKALDENLSAENLLVEAEYFRQKSRASFERTYGWAWLLKLAEETGRCPDPAAKQWEKNLQPLVDVIIGNYFEFLPKQTYPIKRGVHPNTAFGLSFALDYAWSTGNRDLAQFIGDAGRDYYFGCAAVECPAYWEPDGDDFFSPCLMVADLVRRILPQDKYVKWLGKFLPQLGYGLPESLLEPVEVSDRSDPKIVHLDGLNLTRAWCMRGIAAALPDDDPRREILEKSACLHAGATLQHIASGNYEGEHWLASFAVFLLAGGE